MIFVSYKFSLYIGNRTNIYAQHAVIVQTSQRKMPAQDTLSRLCLRDFDQGYNVPVEFINSTYIFVASCCILTFSINQTATVSASLRIYKTLLFLQCCNYNVLLDMYSC